MGAGSVRPNVNRLRTFGKGLELSDAEVPGLILMAGLAPDFEATGELIRLSGNGSELVNDTDNDPVTGAGPPGVLMHRLRMARFRHGGRIFACWRCAARTWTCWWWQPGTSWAR